MVVVDSAGWVVEQECGGSGELGAGGSYAAGKTPRTSACSACSLFGTGEGRDLPLLCFLPANDAGGGGWCPAQPSF